MDAFIGQLQSSGAHKGILYTITGFTRPALEKAAVHGISCCRLYQNAPADIPGALYFSFYCFASSLALGWQSTIRDDWEDIMVAELFNITDAEGKSAMDLLIDSFWQAQELEYDKVVSKRLLPQPWKAAIEISVFGDKASPLIIKLSGIWRVYRAKVEGHLLNGTYIFDEDKFVGSQSTPSIDMRGPEPGPGWEQVKDYPEQLMPDVGIVILKGGNARELILENFGSQKLGDLTI